jgi:thiol-disulfide isomerase/thioredoxin
MASWVKAASDTSERYKRKHYVKAFNQCAIVKLIAMVDLNEIRTRTQTCREYLENSKGESKDEQMQTYRDYKLNEQAMKELKGLVKGVTVVVLGASWCKDCRKVIPVLLHLEEKLGLDVRVFGTIKVAALDSDHQWRIPPSPPEAEDWGVKAIPWIEIFDENGERIDTIIERPEFTPTLEEEFVFLLKKASGRT